MKRLSDYTGTEAFELWADIFDPVFKIISDDKVKKYTAGKDISVQEASKVILKKYPKEAYAILSRIDPDINGANLFPGLVIFVTEMTLGDSARTFFRSAEPEKSDKEPSGSATESIGDGVK